MKMIAVGTAIVIPSKVISSSRPDPDILISVLNEQSRIQGFRDLEEEEMDRIGNAWNAILPATHLEYAIVVSSYRGFEYPYLLDEYIRRRNGEKPEMYNHPLLMLHKWNLPDTCGVILFKEQANCLLREVFDVNSTAASLLIRNLGRKMISDSELRAMLASSPLRLSKSDIENLIPVINRLYVCHDYYWCSNIVTRAGFA